MIKNNPPTLYIFSGLPACGKTTLAQKLVAHTGFSFLRIDTIEQGLRDLCSVNVQGEGYRLSYRIAQDNLKLGCSVVADSCNPISLTRKEWQEVAKSTGTCFENIEIICSDLSIHKQRVENRESSVESLRLPSWSDVVSREYHNWNGSRHVIDTTNKDVEVCFLELLQKLNLATPVANKSFH